MHLLLTPLLLCLATLLPPLPVLAWADHDKVLLRDIQSITLYSDRYTNSRRTSPVPQLACTGGTAGCAAYIPPVVSCQNKGWDGFDVQWECKADMDNSYRFGKLEVSCEGFDYPNDPFVLRGSCGLEYTLDLTEEGLRKSKHSYGGGGSSFGSGFPSYKNSPMSSDAGGAIVIVLFLAVAFVIYKIFLSGGQQQPFADGTGYQNGHGQSFQGPPPPGFSPDFTGSPPPSYGSSFTGSPPPGFKSDYTGTPPPEFKSDYTGASSGFGGFGSSSTFGNAFRTHAPNANSGPGFWTGLGTGGVLGYLFGNRRAQPGQSSYFNTGPGPAFSTPTFGNSSGYSPPQTSSGTRTASGFGGTKRR
ncbi:store-operated calcium entry-associated regulatory factor isoform X2 [Ambystoma mexicanum]|uniref:store-operated calcium entry-associated regulatory factor isoform X2 n=1 Tax=Ambystoma mexicanum TaxID=8296 RepID=UPI0037E7540C